LRRNTGSIEVAIGNCTIGDRSRPVPDPRTDLIGGTPQRGREATANLVEIGQALAAAVCSFNQYSHPEAVIIGGELPARVRTLFEPVAAIPRSDRMRRSATGERSFRPMGEFAGAFGAASNG